ncbi:MAG: hypothetical protein AABZ67_00580 [Pseudomonadota bacterium]
MTASAVPPPSAPAASNGPSRSLIHKISLDRANKLMAYGAVAVTIMVVLGFFALIFVLLARPGIQMSETMEKILLINIGTLTASFTQVVNYYLGSSAGSARKDIAPAAAPIPAPQGGTK